MNKELGNVLKKITVVLGLTILKWTVEVTIWFFLEYFLNDVNIF